MIFRELSQQDAERIRVERNELVGKGILRTPYLLTEQMQADWYLSEIANRESRTRYWGFYSEKEDTYHYFVGYGGLEFIDWVNGMAEMSVMIFEAHLREGFGSQAVEKILEQAFDHLRLDTVCAEVYECNPNQPFWDKMGSQDRVFLPRRKFHEGVLYGSYYYLWTREAYNTKRSGIDLDRILSATTGSA